MPQSRLHLTAGREATLRAFALLESAFEEDGFPVALQEIDEARDVHELSVYVEDGADEVHARMVETLGVLGLAAAIGVEELPDIDWVAKSLEGLKPVRAGRFLVHGAHDRDSRRPGTIAIEIEAGMAFGTGHHGTTAGCLEMIERVVRARRPRRTLDLGTGSAVLAIAIARLAHVPVLATDIDPVAVRVAADNARLNGAAALVECVTATGFEHPVFGARGPFDLIVANILARPLMRMAPQMAAHLAPGGSLILSGILASQRRQVIAAYAGQRFRHVATLWREGWVTMHFKR